MGFERNSHLGCLNGNAADDLFERGGGGGKSGPEGLAAAVAAAHGPLTRGRITSCFLSEGGMETFLTKIFF
jgi:hypothetical protein